MQEKTLQNPKIRTSNIHSSDFGSVSYDIFGSPYQKTGSFLANDSLNFGYLGKPTIARLVIIAHGQQGTGNAYSVDDLPLKITIDNEIPVIDIVVCYASSNPNYKSNSTTIINTYNPGTSTSYISDDDEIWHNQTNEVLKETIPNAILNNISNSSKEPTQKPNKVTKFLMEKLF